MSRYLLCGFPFQNFLNRLLKDLKKRGKQRAWDCLHQGIHSGAFTGTEANIELRNALRNLRDGYPNDLSPEQLEGISRAIATLDYLFEHGRYPLADPPEPDKHGRFASVIGPRPNHWPWVLPHLYAMNVSPETSSVPVEASATPEGELKIKKEVRTLGAVVEMIGFWNGMYCVFDTESLPTLSQAKELAAKWFEELPVRKLMENGVVIREKPDVEVTGRWPKKWAIRTFLDVKILAAYLFEVAEAKGRHEEAIRFRKSLGFAWPMTELLILYRDAFAAAEEYLAPHLDDRSQKLLKSATALLNKWLKRG